MSILGEVIAQTIGELVQWAILKLPRPVQLGCWTVLGVGLVALLIWAIVS